MGTWHGIPGMLAASFDGVAAIFGPEKKENENSLAQSTTKCYAWLTTIPKLLWKWQIFHDIRSNFSFPFGHTHTHAVCYVDIFHT